MKKTLCLFLIIALALSSLGGAALAASEPSISGASAIVIEYETGQVLYEKDADTLRVPASMTKIMTAYIIFEELEAGNITKETQCYVSNYAANMSVNSAYPSAVPLPRGGYVDVETLLRLILLPSASASCVVMAEHISGSEAAFVQRMNETAARLGITAQYDNCHGALPNYTTARSVASLVRHFIDRFPEILSYTSMTSVYFNGQYWSNTNKLLGTYYYEGADGFKTGTLASAGSCLCATAVRDGKRIITVTMMASSDSRRYSDSRALLDFGFAELERIEREEQERYEEALRKAIFKDCAFHWAKDQIEEVYKSGGVMGAVYLNYRPEDYITRAEYMGLLIGVMEKRGEIVMAQGPGFTDSYGHWAERYIIAAQAAGIVSGHGDGTFGSEEYLTREQVMEIADNAFQLPDSASIPFTDADQVSDWAREAVARGAAAGVLKGYPDGSFRPGAYMTRAEAAVVIYRLLLGANA